MTDTSIEALEKRVEQLEEQLEPLDVDDPTGKTVSFGGLLELGLTRRQALAAIGLVAYGSTATAAILKSIGTVDAQSGVDAIHGIDQLGLETDPIGTIYVDNLFQSTDTIDTDRLHIDGFELTLNSTPSSPSEGDVRIVEDS